MGFAVRARRAVGIPQLWAGHRVSEGHIGISGRQRGFWALGVARVTGGLAAGGSVPLENPRAVQGSRKLIEMETIIHRRCWSAMDPGRERSSPAAPA